MPTDTTSWAFLTMQGFQEIGLFASPSRPKKCRKACWKNPYPPLPAFNLATTTAMLTKEKGICLLPSPFLFFPDINKRGSALKLRFHLVMDVDRLKGASGDCFLDCPCQT